MDPGPASFPKRLYRRTVILPRLYWSVRERLERMLYAWEGLVFDRKYGLDTTEHLDKTLLDELPAKRHSRSYVATRSALFRRALRTVDEDLSKYTFVDLGCGKGRTLFLAAEHSFNTIAGVEFSPTLCAIAQKNLEIYRDKSGRGWNATVVCTDARAFRYMNTPHVVFMYDPFDEGVMTHVVGDLERFVSESMQRVYLVYVQPVYRELITRHGVFEEVVFADQSNYAVFRAGG